MPAGAGRAGPGAPRRVGEARDSDGRHVVPARGCAAAIGTDHGRHRAAGPASRRFVLWAGREGRSTAATAPQRTSCSSLRLSPQKTPLSSTSIHNWSLHLWLLLAAEVYFGLSFATFTGENKKIFMSSPARAEGYDTPAQQREDSTTEA